MKKVLATLAVVLTLSFVTIQVASAAPGWGNGWGCNGPGYGRFGSSEEAKKAYEAREQFYADTAEIRKELYEKRSEYFDIVNGENGDKEAAKELWSKIFDLQKEIRSLAEEKGVFLGGPEYCLGPNGYYERAEKSSFRGRRGFQRGWMMDTNVNGERGYHQGLMWGTGRNI